MCGDKNCRQQWVLRSGAEGININIYAAIISGSG